jgi:hypothetical protein
MRFLLVLFPRQEDVPHEGGMQCTFLSASRFPEILLILQNLPQILVSPQTLSYLQI